MKNNKQRSEIELALGNLPHTMPVWIYIVICIAGIAVISVIFNELIERHDRELTTEICNLVNEKVTGSLDYMTKSAEDISIIMAYNESENYDGVYKQLRDSMDEADYLSIGIIMTDGTIYSSESDEEDLRKWNLIDKALTADGVSISDPYRSGLTGQLVFTMFSGIDRDGERIGSLYVTYPFDEILKITYSDSLDSNTEVWLMDRYSDNIIRCSGTEDYLIGSWSNMKLNKDITGNDEYDEWAKHMHDGESTASVTYSAGNESYTQVYESIGVMDGWNVVVRIPNKALSSSMRVFRIAVMIFASVVTVATLALLVSSKRRSDAENKILANLSVYDPLSKVLNRRAFDLSAEQYLLKSGKTAGALMFLDIDLFKNINDKYGHESGDVVIVQVAAALRDMFGSQGIVSRYGGDEFVVLIKNLGREEISSMMSELKKNIADIKLLNAKDFEVHFSAGLAEFPKNGTDMKQLIKCADDALYMVKKNGRNGFGWAENENIAK